MKKIIIFGVMFLLMIGGAFAISEYNYNKMDFWSKIKYTFYHLGKFTIVNGATCDTYYYVSGYTDVLITRYCPSSARGKPNYGCSLDKWWGHYGSYMGQTHLDPGQDFNVYADQTWEIYLCQDKECLCGTEYSGGCGAWTCDDDEMYRYRTCDPPDCSWEQLCVSGYQQCQPCDSHYERKCYGGDVYWYDSCGDREDRYEECPSSDWVGVQWCEDNDVYRKYETVDCYGATCRHTREDKKYEECGTLRCSGGQCLTTQPCICEGISCSTDSDCCEYPDCGLASYELLECEGGVCTKREWCSVTNAYFNVRCDGYWSVADYCTSEGITSFEAFNKDCRPGTCDSSLSFDLPGGQCRECNTEADINCNGIVDRDELGEYINKWMNDEISRSILGKVIQAWSES